MANVKISALTADTSPTSDDLVATVTDPAGTPASRKVTATDLITKAHGLADGAVVSVSSSAMVTNAITATATELNYTDGVTSAIQTQLDGKQAIDSDLTTIAGLTATTDNFIQSKASAWASRTPTQVTADLIAMVGDSGAGGTKGLVPAPGAGDAAANKYLKASGAWAAIAGGQSTFDVIVDAAGGGNYTTLGAALAAVASGSSIFVRAGSYTESAISSALNDVTIFGASNTNTVITMAANNLTFTGTNNRIQNLKITTTTGIITIGAYNQVYDCYMTHTGANYCLVYGGNYAKVERNYFLHSGTGNIVDFNTKYYATFNSNTVESSTAPTTGINISSIGVTVANNVIRIVAASGTCTAILSTSGSRSNAITGNTVEVGGGATFTGIRSNGLADSITGNAIGGAQTAIHIASTRLCIISGNTIDGATTYGIYIPGSSRTMVSGNSVTGSGKGIYLDSTLHTVVGNTISGSSTGIELTASATNCSVGQNTFNFCTTNLTNASTTSQIMNNMGTPATQNIRMEFMKNTSGGSLTVGTLVVYKSVANGDEFTTTTTGGDSKVYGVVTATIADAAYGYVQTLGKTVSLKVDGTTDIAIGDFISAFTTAGIGQKATAGQTAIAIALEAYTTNDSNGVIDALIVSPRLI